MTEIVINRCFRGALFSEAGLAEYARRKGLSASPDSASIDRSDPILVAMMKEDMGKRIWAGPCSKARIVTIPDGLPWRVVSKANFEWVAGG